MFQGQVLWPVPQRGYSYMVNLLWVVSVAMALSVTHGHQDIRPAVGVSFEAHSMSLRPQADVIPATLVL